MFYPHSHHRNPDNNSPYLTKTLYYQKGISSDLHVSHEGYTHDSVFCHFRQRMHFKLFYFIYKVILKWTKKWTQGQCAWIKERHWCLRHAVQLTSAKQRDILKIHFKKEKYILKRVIHWRIKCAPTDPASQGLWSS